MFEVARLLSQAPCPGGFTHLRLALPSIAAKAQPGQSVLWANRQMPIMRADAKAGWLELLVKGDVPPEGQVEGPLGNAVVLTGNKTYTLLIADLATLPSLIFLADQLRTLATQPTLVLLQADDELPFRPVPCRTMIPGIPNGIIATLPLLNDWGIAVRIATHADLPGCFDGDVEQLAQYWLRGQSTDDVEVLRLLKNY